MIELMFMLCLSFSGGEDCSWEWKYEPDKRIFGWDWMMYQTSNMDSENIGAFTDFRTKTIILNDMKWISHEARHAICWLEFQDKHAGQFNFNQCNQDIDTGDLIKQIRHPGYNMQAPPERDTRLEGIVL